MKRDAKCARLSDSMTGFKHSRLPYIYNHVGVENSSGPLVAMVLDVDEGPAGSFLIWARTSQGATALVQVRVV